MTLAGLSPEMIAALRTLGPLVDLARAAVDEKPTKRRTRTKPRPVAKMPADVTPDELRRAEADLAARGIS